MFWDQIFYEEQRRKELLRTAEQRRLVRQALAARGPRPGVGRRLLAGLGSRLIAWGWWLQRQFGSPQGDATAPETAVDCGQ